MVRGAAELKQKLWYEAGEGEKAPRAGLLEELAKALGEAEHKNVAGHLLAGWLWAVYPEWFERHWKKD
jgi:hypothetical protein